MSLLYVMRPDNVEDPDPVFTRYGRLTHNIETALNRASKCLGKVYEVDGTTTSLRKSFWVAPKPRPRLNSREYRPHDSRLYCSFDQYIIPNRKFFRHDTCPKSRYKLGPFQAKSLIYKEI